MIRLIKGLVDFNSRTRIPGIKLKHLIISMFHNVPGVPRVKMERFGIWRR